VSLGFVAAAVKRKAETKSNFDRQRSGRPPRITTTIVKRTTKLLRETNTGSIRKASVELRRKGIDVSRTTVGRIAKRAHLRSALPITKPVLTRAARAARLAWATLHLNDDDDTIERYVFEDEKWFRVTDPTHRVWLYPTEPTPIREKAAHPLQLMVSAVITSRGRSSLVLYPAGTTMDAAEYLSTLRNEHIPQVRLLYPSDNFCWIQDNASPHTARVVDDWLSTQAFRRDATFPAHSPDLNLTENVFGIMVERMSSEKITTAEQLEAALIRTWASITRSDLLSLYASWSDRVRAVVDANGGHTRF